MAIAELAGGAPTGVGTVSAAEERDVVGEVYRLHHDRLIGFFMRRTNDRRLSEDLAHDTFVRLAGAVDRLDPARPVWPYLRAIATNVGVDQQRRDARQVDLDVEERLVEEPAPGEDLDETVVLRGLLERAIGDLSQRQQVAVELRCCRGWNVAESAEFLGIEPGAFRQLLFRARKNLRVELEKSGVWAPDPGTTRMPTL